ncbi:MAG: carbon-nitrogen hydrolase family protein [Gemmatimonadales bacterium]|jgi:predicted amidohydrolase
MSHTFNVALIQNCAGPEVEANIAETLAMSREAADLGAALICLPENFSALSSEGPRLTMAAFTEPAHPALPRFSELAREQEIWVLLGSLPIAVAGGKIRNRSYLLGPDGTVLRRYDKIHLFDVELAGGEQYRESATVEPGSQAVIAELPWGRLGMTICYDLRFPHLYRTLAQAGADFLAVPAAFTKTSGEAHWHALNRARAIENGSYVFAPCQCGEHAGGGWTYGHSLVVDPWGRVLADGGEDPGVVLCEVDPARVAEARSMIPSLRHDRPYDRIE